MKVLYVEDDIEIRNNLRFYLNSIFDEVLEVSDGEDALKIYKEESPDIILLDINIPKINGIEVARKIRENDKNVLIIVTTAHDDKEILLNAIELNLTKYLLKPISRHILKDTLSKALNEIKELELIPLVNNYIWNKNTLTLIHEDKVIKLTNNEVKLLKEYCTKTKHIFSNEDIFFTIYNDSEYNENKIRMFLKRFRKNTNHDLLINIYGVGYKFNYKLN